MIKIRVNLLVFLAALLVLPGCVGTFLSRTDNDIVGRYPGEAVLMDVALIVGSGDHISERVAGIFSLIPDIALDTILLPADLIGWPFGLRKSAWFNRKGWR